MRSVKPVTALVAAGTVLAATAAAGVGAAQDAAPQPATLELVARDRDSRFGFVDAAPRRRESPGDVFTISARLRDGSGRSAGRAHAVFTQTSASDAQGSATFVLAAGRIVATGVLREPGATDELTVVGGSGAYAGARGSVTVAEARGATRFRFALAG